MNSDELLSSYLERVHEDHKLRVKNILMDLIFYRNGDLSYHHASPFVKALLTNRLSHISQRATEVDMLYLGLYGDFIYEHIPSDKLMSPD